MKSLKKSPPSVALRRNAENKLRAIDGRMAHAQAYLKTLQEQRQLLAGKPPSRQIAWRQRRVDEGLCAQCGREKIDPGSKSLGRRCLRLQAERMKARRKKDASKPS